MRARRAGKPSWRHWGILQREEVAGLPGELAAVGADACCLAPASPWERGTVLGAGDLSGLSCRHGSPSAGLGSAPWALSAQQSLKVSQQGLKVSRFIEKQIGSRL